MNKKYGFGVVCLLFFLFCFSCGHQKESISTQGISSINLDSLITRAKAFKPKPGKVGGEIVLSSFSDPKSFNPITSSETTTSEFTSYMFEGLTRTNGVTTEVEPHLALSWDVSRDGLMWTFHLRKDVLWFNGKPFTSTDVVFTFENLIYNDDIPNSSRDIFTINGQNIKVMAQDSFTVQFVLPAKFVPFLRSMSQEILPKEVYEPTVLKKTFVSSMGADSRPEEIVGCGPFMLESYKPSQGVILKRNPHYWKKNAAGQSLPYLDKIRYVIVQDQNAELLKFKQGETDYLEFRGQDFPMLKREESQGGYTLYRLGPNFGSSFLFFNLNAGKDSKGKPYVDPAKHSWFENVLFRRAVAYAMDRKSIIQIALNGLGYPQHSAMSPASGFFYNPNVPQYDFDLTKAKSLLKEAGFEDKNRDGFIEDPKGNTVEFSLVTNSGNTVRKQIGEMISKDLKNLGFNVHFNLLEFNTLIAKLDATCDWEACIMGLTGGIEPHFGANVWRSSGNLHMWWPRQKTPATIWEKRIDEIFEKAVQELDPAKRKAYYDEWQVIVAQELPLIHTVLAERLTALRNKFENINPAPYGGVLHNLDEIYVK